MWYVVGKIMLERIGFFHFVCDHGKPLPSLIAALSEHNEISGSPVVLPEAFNIGKPYREAGCCNFDPSVLSSLCGLSMKYQVVFVAGLIVETSGKPYPPYSSAYLIDGEGPRLMCHKMTKDGYDHRNCTPCTANCDGENFVRNCTPCTANCDGEDPVQYGDACIGAVICRDVDHSRFDALVQRVKGFDSAWKILCVPSCMSRHYFSGNTLSDLRLKGKYVVLANSDPEGCGSFVTNTDGVKVRRAEDCHNTIDLLPLPTKTTDSPR
ncbi:MAG: nitrilase-related carbon-nitrogen hydrolase [Bryobacteraceae bacterium]